MIRFLTSSYSVIGFSLIIAVFSVVKEYFGQDEGERKIRWASLFIIFALLNCVCALLTANQTDKDKAVADKQHVNEVNNVNVQLTAASSKLETIGHAVDQLNSTCFIPQSDPKSCTLLTYLIALEARGKSAINSTTPQITNAVPESGQNALRRILADDLTSLSKELKVAENAAISSRQQQKEVDRELRQKEMVAMGISPEKARRATETQPGSSSASNAAFENEELRTSALPPFLVKVKNYLATAQVMIPTADSELVAAEQEVENGCRLDRSKDGTFHPPCTDSLDRLAALVKR